jgi:hypothetical protein
VVLRGEPVLINGGGTIKALSAEFLYDLQKFWKVNKEQVLKDVATKYPAQFFAGMVTLSKVVRWEVGEAGAFDRPSTPEEVMDRLEQRIGPQARKMFERFLRKVQKLEEQQVLQLQAKGDDEVGADDLGLGRHLRAL